MEHRFNSNVLIMNEHTCGCGNAIHPERINLGFKVCIVCGEKIALKKKPFGSMIYNHKTSGELQIVDKNMIYTLIINSIVITSKAGFDNYTKVSYRKNKGSNMGYVSRLTTSF